MQAAKWVPSRKLQMFPSKIYSLFFQLNNHLDFFKEINTYNQKILDPDPVLINQCILLSTEDQYICVYTDMLFLPWSTLMSKTVGYNISEMYMLHSLRHTAPAERVGQLPNIFLLEKAFALISANSRKGVVLFLFGYVFAFAMNKRKGQGNHPWVLHRKIKPQWASYYKEENRKNKR